PALSSPKDGSVQSSATVKLAGTAEPHAIVLVDEGPTQRGSTTADGNGDWTLDLTGVADGSHTYTLRAHDAAGNASSAATVHVTVDSAAPQTAFDSGPSGTTNDSSPSFAFSADEPGSTFE